MQFLKSLCIFGMSFGVVFCAVCFANAESIEQPGWIPNKSSMGAAAGQTAEGVFETVRNTAFLIFARSEGIRLVTAARLDARLVEVRDMRTQKESETPSVDNTDTGVIEVRSIRNQWEDASGIVEGLKMQWYTALSFLVSNIYAFYTALGLLIAWCVHVVWKYVARR